MSWIVVNIHWIMILSGVLTMTMVFAALWIMVFAASCYRCAAPPTGDLNIGSVGTA